MSDKLKFLFNEEKFMKDKDVHRESKLEKTGENLDEPDECGEYSVLKQERKIEEDLRIAENEENKNEEKVEWDGSEAERVADSDAEEYEDSATGIRFSYRLERDEVYKCLKHSSAYKRNANLQVRHTVIQVIVMVVLLIISFAVRDKMFAYVALVPLVCVAGIWLIPRMSLKKLAERMYGNKEIRIAIFPDTIEVEVGGIKSEILLDGKCEYEEFEDMIILSPCVGNSVIIPVRCIEPEFLPDVQAMIVSGTLPKDND